MTGVDDPLDPLLHAWAERQRLDEDAAERMLQAIIAEPRTAAAAVTSSLPADWWSDFSAQICAAVVLATSRPDTSGGFAAPSMSAA